MIYSSVDDIIIRIEELYQRYQFLITYEIEEKSTSIVSTESSKETAIERFFLEVIQYLEANDLI